MHSMRNIVKNIVLTFVWLQMVTRLTVVIMLQCIQISNHYVIMHETNITMHINHAAIKRNHILRLSLNS